MRKLTADQARETITAAIAALLKDFKPQYAAQFASEGMDEMYSVEVSSSGFRFFCKFNDSFVLDTEVRIEFSLSGRFGGSMGGNVEVGWASCGSMDVASAVAVAAQHLDVATKATRAHVILNELTRKLAPTPEAVLKEAFARLEQDREAALDAWRAAREAAKKG